MGIITVPVRENKSGYEHLDRNYLEVIYPNLLIFQIKEEPRPTEMTLICSGPTLMAQLGNQNANLVYIPHLFLFPKCLWSGEVGSMRWIN